jgi:myo-inositol catabolism protein IolS
MNRRTMFSGAALAVGSVAGVALWRNWSGYPQPGEETVNLPEPPLVARVGGMPYRAFGSTGLQVSEVGFGSWAIGGKAYGAVEHEESLRALARAEELGCNFVDTAGVYGDAEAVLGEFLQGRRDKWVVSTKYSGQPRGMTATLEEQLGRLRTDHVDFYMIHWVPRDDEQPLYDELRALKQAGKARFVGVSMSAYPDVDYVLDHQDIDGVMAPFSLLDPAAYLPRRQRLLESGKAVIIRSSLKEGFLTGKYRTGATFPDPNDQRHEWSREQIDATIANAERFRFLEPEAGSMVAGALAYPLSFPEVSTVVVGAKSVRHVDGNFGEIPGKRLSAGSLRQVLEIQRELDLMGERSMRGIVKRLLGRY